MSLALDESEQAGAIEITKNVGPTQYSSPGPVRFPRAANWIKGWHIVRCVRAARERGSTATNPFHVSAFGWASIIVDAWRNGRNDNLNVLSAGIAFYMFIALIPFLAAVAMVYGLFAGPASVAEDIRSALAIIPGGAEEFVANRIARVIVNGSVGPMAAVLAILLATYSAARGVRAIVAGLNVMMDRPNRKRSVDKWTLALIIALSGACLMLLALSAIAIQGYVETYLPDRKPALWLVIQTLFWIAMAISVSAALAVLYRFGPAGPKSHWILLLPGALAATIVWLFATLAFGAYVSTFGRYDATYGSIAALVILQLWLYLSATAMLFGAKINAQVAQHLARSTASKLPVCREA